MEFNILCGIPGSGKSTLGKDLQGFLVSTDSIRKFLWDDESVVKHDKLVFELADSMMKYMLSVGNNVVFDATNLTVDRRSKYIHLAKAYNAFVTVHWVDCPLNVAIHRNSLRDRKVPIPIIRALYKSFVQPTIGEGMDKIIIYTEDLSVQEIITCP